MILVEVDPVMVLATGITATTWMLAVLSNTTVTVAHVAPEFSRLTESGRLMGQDCMSELVNEYET